MKVVFAGKSDDSSTSNRIARALRKHGVDARCIATQRSKAEYDEDIVVTRDGWDAAMRTARGADWVMQLGDGDYRHFMRLLVKLGIANGGQTAGLLASELRRRQIRLGMRHAGTLFRQDPRGRIAFDNKLRFQVRFIPCDLYRHVKTNGRYRPFIQAQDEIREAPRKIGGPLRVCHTPSNPAKKGTDVIVEAMSWASST